MGRAGALGSGLYYLSEIVEEHTVIAKRTLTRMIYAVIATQVLLALVDNFPWTLSALSIASHVVYMQNLRRFPIVKLTDPIFLVSCGLVLLNHWLWFRHFSPPPPNRRSAPFNYLAQPQTPSFTEIASFFGLNVWLVPFALFVSLSAGEYVLPSMGSEYATGQGSSFVSPGREPLDMNGGVRRGRHKRSNTQSGMAKVAVSGVREWISETGELLGVWKGERTRPI